MKNLIKNVITFIIAIVGFVGGLIWAFQSEWQIEPIILTIVSSLEVIAFFLIEKKEETNPQVSNKNKVEQHVNINLNVENQLHKKEKIIENKEELIDRNTIIDSMKLKTKILFIDDDKSFNMVKILKDSGWRNTKTVVDIKTLDVPCVKEADIIFVDINGVGKLLKLEYQGLDLSLMLKQKYDNKKIIIYSANKNSNSFHDAWNKCDYKLEKNALPYQFQNLVEEYSLELYKMKK